VDFPAMKDLALSKVNIFSKKKKKIWDFFSNLSFLTADFSTIVAVVCGLLILGFGFFAGLVNYSPK
jgi:hypothetical protein